MLTKLFSFWSWGDDSSSVPPIIPAHAIEINFKRLNATDDLQLKLADFFKAQSKKGIQRWYRSQLFTFKDGVPFYFANTIILRKTKVKSDKVIMVLEALTHKYRLGAGNSSEVFKVQRTITLYENNSFVINKASKTQKRRVVKVQNFIPQISNNAEDWANRISCEYQLTKIAGYSIKKPLILAHALEPSGKTSYTFMEMLPGQDLFDIINTDFINNHSDLTTQVRLELTHALLLALKIQVTDKGLIHRDIKTENIRVTLGPPIQVKIFDFGFSVFANQADCRTVGTLEYVPFEVCDNKIPTFKADVFPLARVISEVWGVVLGKLKSTSYDNVGLLLYGLFKGLDVPDELKSNIKDLLLKMLAKDLEARISVNEALVMLERFYKPTPLNMIPSDSILKQNMSDNAPSFFKNPREKISQLPAANPIYEKQYHKKVAEMMAAQPR